MSNKIFAGIIVVVLIIAGYVLYKNYSDKNDAGEGGNSVVFRCENGTGFTARFSEDMETVDILVANKVERSLPNIGDERVSYRFGDESRVYTFVGEEVVVADLASETSIVCTQPFDNLNAPYNFGDTGEGAGENNDQAAAARENIIGSWQSTDDAKFIREFATGGVIIDHYEGVDNTSGTWSAFTSEANIETPFPQDAGAVYFEVVMNDFPEEVLYFELAKLTPEELELFFLGRGGVLAFTRVE